MGSGLLGPCKHKKKAPEGAFFARGMQISRVRRP